MHTLHKLLLLPAILLLSSTEGIAQKVPSPVFVFAEAGGGPGSMNHGFIELNSLFLNHHLISIGYAAFSRKAAVPEDYNGEGLLGPTVPQDYLDGLTIQYGYVLYPKRSRDRLRYFLRGGVLIGTYSEPANFHRVGGFLGPNYAYDDIAEPAVAAIFRPGLTYSPSRAFGLSCGVYVVAGKASGAGIWGSMALGYVGSHARARKHKAK